MTDYVKLRENPSSGAAAAKYHEGRRGPGPSGSPARERIRVPGRRGQLHRGPGRFAQRPGDGLPARTASSNRTATIGRSLPVALILPTTGHGPKAGSWGALTVEKIIRIDREGLRTPGCR